MIEEFYKKKLIRDFLSLFSETKWKELLILIAEYGIILLKRNYNIASISLDDISTIIDDLKEEDKKIFKKIQKNLEMKNLQTSCHLLESSCNLHFIKNSRFKRVQ